MRNSKCKHVSQLIALYVAGDLAGATEREVAAHLAACDGCQSVSEGFAESRGLLAQAGTLPEFGPEFYAGIRGAVLGEIRRDRRLSTPSLFRRPWIYATSFAIVIVAFLFVLQHAQRQQPGVAALAWRTAGQTISGQARGTNSSSASATPQLSRSADGSALESRRKPHRNPLFGASRRGPLQIGPLSGTDSPEMAERAPERGTPNSAVLELAKIVGSAAAATALNAQSLPAVPPRVSRIEIQTRDPNIRIIWLTTSAAEGTEDINHDQELQHGDRK